MKFFVNVFSICMVVLWGGALFADVQEEISDSSYGYYARQVKDLKDPNPHQVPGFDDYTYVQIGFWVKSPKAILRSNVFGWKIGVPLSTGYGRVFGLESSILASCTDEIKGVQTGLVNVAKSVDGVQAGMVNVSDGVKGVQIGLVNVSKSTGCQFGLINYIEGAWVPCWPFCNVSF